MSNSTKEAILIGVEVLVSIVIFSIALFLVNQIHGIQSYIISTKYNYLDEYKRFVRYDNSIVKGYEIPGIIGINARKYKFLIVQNGVTYEISPVKETIYGKVIWTPDYISGIIGNYINSDYKTILIKNKYNQILGIQFIKQ